MAPPQQQDKQAPSSNNKLLPEFNDNEDYYKYFGRQAQTFPVLPPVSRWQKFLSIFRKAAPQTQPPAQPIKNVVIVSAHGWYPATRIVKTVFGESEGTSEKFAEMMEEAIHEYFNSTSNTKDSRNLLRITTIPLSGHGKVLARVDAYLSMIKANIDWVTLLQRAHLVMFVTHSQGTPVMVSLIAELLRKHLIDSRRQCIGVLCMAGIGHGPDLMHKDNLVIQYVETDAARELFEYSDGGLLVDGDYDLPSSPIARRLWEDLKFVVECDVYMTLIASWRDQAVPVYSALMTAFHHPHIYRSIHIDHFNYRNDFFTRLMVFLVKIRNLGIRDYQLLFRLSHTLSSNNSLVYNSAEHSTVYDELNVYKAAVQWTIYNHRRNQSHGNNHVTLRYQPFKIELKPNPYYIPWAMHQLLTDDLIQSDDVIKSELQQLVNEEFSKWVPLGRSARDLRFRLDPLNQVKAKL